MTRDDLIAWHEQEAAWALTGAALCDARRAAGRPFVDDAEATAEDRWAAGMHLAAVNHLRGVSPE